MRVSCCECGILPPQTVPPDRSPRTGPRTFPLPYRTFPSPILTSNLRSKCLQKFMTRRSDTVYVGYYYFQSSDYRAPTYLADLLHRRAAVRHTRSSTPDSLDVPSIRTEMASRAFSHAAPTIWNNLPHDIRETTSINSFRTRLKTFYCK